ncbi:MAG: zinc-dependent alcohol dehydrogenase family protein [Gammaproteobacteria bacterium]
MKSYTLAAGGGIDDLEVIESDVPRPGSGQVLVRMHAASLNYRDLLIVNGMYPRNQADRIIPISDGAGLIEEIGPEVERFRPGDRVAGTFMQRWKDGVMADGDGDSALGGSLDGVLCEYRLFDEQGLVSIPSHLSFSEAATLPCAAVTAWHALFEGVCVRPGDSVLILGSGGVATFALQLARAAGASTIMTSSSDEKLSRLAEIGATSGVNYRTCPEWATRVREINRGLGVDHVVENGGGMTLGQSIAATRRGGSIHQIGVIAPGEIDPVHILLSGVTVRGIEVGSRAMFERLNRALEVNHIHPLIDRSFHFNETQAAYRYFAEARHIGKVVIEIT